MPATGQIETAGSRYPFLLTVAMPGAVRVLCVGHDILLLQTRKLVLERHYSVVTATTLKGLTSATAGEQISLVVLCHSLSWQERFLAAQIVKETWPRAKILEVLSSREVEAAGENSEVLLGLDGPVALLEKAASLLDVPPPSSESITLVRKRRLAPHGQ